MSHELRMREESLDVVQSVCRQVLESSLPREQGDERVLPAWLITAIENKLIDHYRHLVRAKRDVGREQHLASGSGPKVEGEGPGPSTEAAKHEEALHLREAMTELDAREREALELHYAEGLSYPAIAERLGITLKQARWGVAMAKLKLAQKLGGEGSDGSNTPASKT
jgi:RNA polymerase sigma-70 factor (ECF subfamily)